MRRLLLLLSVLALALGLLWPLAVLGASSADAASPSCPTLKAGAYGPIVATLDGQLNKQRVVSPKLTVTQQFQAPTTKAVNQVKAAHGLAVDGVAGPLLWQAVGGCVPGGGGGGPCGQSSVPTYHHVVFVVLENHSYGSIIGSSSAPFINGLAAQCGLATNYHSTTHNSLPNYLALTSGLSVSALQPFVNDCLPSVCTTSASSIFGQLGSSARSYEESMTSNCEKGNDGEYAPKHNPEAYYSSLSGCSSSDVPLGTLSSSALLDDLGNDATAPAFSFVTPNLCDDMHDCSVSTGDSWLSSWINAILGTAAYKAGDTAVFVTFDEGEPASAGEDCAANPGDESCHVATLVIAPSVPLGAQVGTAYTHYGLLATAEDLLGLPRLGQAASATSLVSGFNL